MGVIKRRVLVKKTKYQLKKQLSSVVANVARYIVIISFGYMLIYPIIFLVFNALKSTADYYDVTVQWVPKNWSLNSFKLAIQILDYGKALISTISNEIVAALIEVFSCMVAAYGLSRFDIKGKKILTFIMIITMLIPFPMLLIPSYVNYRFVDFLGILKLIGGLVGTELRPSILDTPLVFWIPSLLAVGLKGSLFIYIYCQFFKGLPRELEEAAWMDGAGAWKTFISIIIPSSVTSIITVLLFSVIWHWNDYYLAQTYLSKDYPLGVLLVNINQLVSRSVEGVTSMNQGGIIMAASFLMIAPMLVFYILLQKKFVASVSTSGIVG